MKVIMIQHRLNLNERGKKMNTEVKISYLENKVRDLTERIETLELKVKQLSSKIVKVDKNLTSLWGKVKI